MGTGAEYADLETGYVDVGKGHTVDEAGDCDEVVVVIDGTVAGRDLC